MEAIKLKARIGAGAVLEWLDPPPDLPTGEVEVIVLYEHRPPDLSLLPVTITWSDKSHQIDWSNRLFETLGITEHPISIEEVQRQMGEAGLEENELSRDLVAMRDE
ncbi:MAG: hypothetical protein HC884_18070 [Chloroflexaceae bacterium]|nr:hypothetical protein [Chloroflexaceae bacterium]